jgi:hypothetical protein
MGGGRRQSAGFSPIAAIPLSADNNHAVFITAQGNTMLERDLAKYVLVLDDAAAVSRQKEDGPLYQKYRAHAGLLLALAIKSNL